MSVFLSRRLSRPILQLQERMKEVEKGNFDIQVPVGNTREIGRLARTFNLMVGRIKELMAQVVEEQEFKRKTELSALQAQINPHFLYNTLDSIIWMAESKKSEEVVLMTSALSKLFRASISKGEELVPIRNEMEHIFNYLTIQKIRYRDKLEFHIDTDPDILHFQTLKIVLQPIVENAIYHGIKNKYGVGVIRITGEKRDGEIRLQVIDNGVGMEPEQAKRC
ncbi:sensor histidine kinase [Paenibacillus sp. P25]|nr:sensor histidine kinase [Paenibacillus sp. P25]